MKTTTLLHLPAVCTAMALLTVTRMSGQSAATPPAVAYPEYIPGQYIVTLKADVQPEQVIAFHQLRPRFVYKHAIVGFAGSMPDAVVPRLLSDPRILRVEPDQVGHYNDVEPGATWGLDRIDQRYEPLDGLYSYLGSGKGVTVYMIDSGIRYSHAEFAGRARFGFDWTGGDGSDCLGHGTHTAGTVGGATYGVAKEVSLVSVKVGDCTSSVAASSVIAGINWVIANRVLPAAANMSLGWAGGNASIDDAVRNMVASGVVTAVSAGNDSTDACTQSPARVAEVMTVGAVDSADTKPTWSNYGSCVDWFAPGVSITSASYLTDTGTAVMSGTSMAAPHTAGVAALYLQNYPLDTPEQVKSNLWSFSTKNVVNSSLSSNRHLLVNFEEIMVGPQLEPPVVAVASPIDGSTITRNSKLTINANASDADDSITSVKFYVNGQLLSTDIAAPYTCSFKTAPQRGVGYTIYTVATDASGLMTQSSSIAVTTK